MRVSLTSLSLSYHHMKSKYDKQIEGIFVLIILIISIYLVLFSLLPY